MNESKEDTTTMATTPQVNNPINPLNNRPSIISSFFAFSEKLASSRYLRWAMIVLLPVLILLRYPVDPRDYDVWWQMALGKYYLAHHTLVVDHSIFSWTPADPAWIYNTCLGSIIFYMAYSLMGGFGLWAIQWLIFMGVFLSFYFFLRLIRQRFDVTSVTLIAAIGIACSLACSYYKPELFSPLLFCWTLFIFFCVKLTRKKFLFYLYPFIFALWVNLHGAFIFGFFFLALAFIGELLNRIFFSHESFTTEELAHLWFACVLSLAATLLNPYGMDYLVSIYNMLTSDSYMGLNNKYVLAYLGLWSFLKEFKSSSFVMSQVAWIMSLMMFSMVCLFLYELIKKRNCDFTLLIVNFALYWKGMETSRASYFFPLAFFFLFFYLLHRLKLKRITGRATILSLLVLFFFFVNISYFILRYNPDNKWFGAGLDSLVPVNEVSFLKKCRLEGPIFNDYVIGGYLLWDLYPGYKVFIDPRCGPYWKKVYPDYIVLTSIEATSKDIKNFTEKYPFKIVILHYRQLPLIFNFLTAGDEWRLLYFEKNAAIMIHKSLLPKIPPEMNAVSLSPMRFREVKNPAVLINIFNFYVHLDPKAGRDIYNIFKNNVSNCYKLKTEYLKEMDSEIRQKELNLQYLKNGHALPVQK